MSHHPNNQKASDYESAWSPTSPLDFRLFSSSSSRSIQKGQQKSWDSGKVGLSIVDSLDDHLTDSSRILRTSLDCKNIIFGSWIRSHKPHLPKTPMENDDKSNVDLIKQTPGALDGHTESDIEISEDYTCVISHGPNSKTTHFYGDKVLQSVEHNGLKKPCFGNKKESIFVIAPLNLTTPIYDLYSNDLMSFCCSCNKKLSMGKDIYMYRGDKPFCSIECRSEEIQMDEEMDEKEVMSSSSSDKDSDGVNYTVA